MQNYNCLGQQEQRLSFKIQKKKKVVHCEDLERKIYSLLSNLQVKLLTLHPYIVRNDLQLQCLHVLCTDNGACLTICC